MPDLPTLPTEPTLCNYGTRWYPRGIQKLVSTYKLPDFHGGGGVKTQSAKSWPNFNCGGGGGEVNWGE